MLDNRTGVGGRASANATYNTSFLGNEYAGEALPGDGTTEFTTTYILVYLGRICMVEMWA